MTTNTYIHLCGAEYKPHIWAKENHTSVEDIVGIILLPGRDRCSTCDKVLEWGHLRKVPKEKGEKP